MDDSLYARIGGADALARLARAWHARCLADEVVSHAFTRPDQRPDAEHLERLTAYWIEQLGGPTAYTDVFGDHVSVLRMHSGEGDHAEMDARAVVCMEQALDDIGLVAAEARTEVLAWWSHMVDEMAAYPRSPDDVPAGLPMPIWRAS